MNEVVDELLYAMSMASIPRHRSMYVHVDIDRTTLYKMATLGPVFVSSWAICYNLLQYHRSTGYSAGAIIRQVVDTVNAALYEGFDDHHDDDDDSGAGGDREDGGRVGVEPSKLPSSSNYSGDFDKIITLDRWAVNGPSSSSSIDDPPPMDGWTKLVGDGRITFYSSSSPPLLNSKIMVEVTRSTIELHLITMEEDDSGYDDDNGSDNYNCDFYRCSRIIVFNCLITTSYDDDNVQLNLLAAREQSHVLNLLKPQPFTTTDVTLVSSQDDLKFMFRNALVYVDNNTSKTMSSNSADANVPIAITDHDDDEDEDDDDDNIAVDIDSTISEIDVDKGSLAVDASLPIDASSRSRPSTAVIRIVLRDPTPPPTPPPRVVPYHLMATSIQVLYRSILRMCYGYVMAGIACYEDDDEDDDDDDDDDDRDGNNRYFRWIDIRSHYIYYFH